MDELMTTLECLLCGTSFRVELHKMRFNSPNRNRSFAQMCPSRTCRDKW
jgi:hypothetical protein